MFKKYFHGRTAVFIDAANILYSQHSLGWKVDYKKLIQYFKNNSKLVFAGFYYSTKAGDDSQDRFFSMLKDRGYTIRTKPIKYIKTLKGTILKGNLDVELAFDILSMKNKFKTCVLLSGDSDFEVIVGYLRSLKKKVIVLSTKGHVSIELIKNCDKYIDLKKLKEDLIR